MGAHVIELRVAEPDGLQARLRAALSAAHQLAPRVEELENAFVDGSSARWLPELRRKRLAELVAKTLELRGLLDQVHADERRLRLAQLATRSS